MEQNVWTEPEIMNILKNNVVLISLYVDDKRTLTAEEIVDSKLNPGKKIKYIGQKWSEMQTLRYQSNSQPYYVLMDHNEKTLLEPVGYTAVSVDYKSWLEEGLSKFTKEL